MAAGEPVDHENDLFGADVTLAARICDAANPQEVWVSELVLEFASEEEFVFEAGARAELKGFSEPVTVFRLLG